MVNFPIFVPSKGRAKTATSMPLLEVARMRYCLVVHPDEAETYRAQYPNAIICPWQRTGMTLGAIRNLILDYAREEGIKWFWMLDDDITQFRYWGEEVQSAKILREMEPILLKSQFVMGSLEHTAYARNAPRNKPYAINRAIYQICAVNAEGTKPLRYTDTRLWEDADFQAKVLYAGYHTVTFKKYSYSRTEALEGGMEGVYGSDDTIRECAEAMQRKWPELATFKVEKARSWAKPEGTVTTRFHWERLKPSKEMEAYLLQGLPL